MFTCTGVGIENRGIESFFREAFDGLKDRAGIEAVLLKGAGSSGDRERVVPCLRRTGLGAAVAGKCIGRNAYVAEQLSSAPAVVTQIRRIRPHVIFYGDSNLGFQLFRFRRWIGVPFRLLFSNGGPCIPPFDRTDYVQQVAPFYFDEAIRAGESSSRHIMVPYGIRVSPLSPVNAAERAALRRRLGLPVDRPVVLSVGWISRTHKRMHYVVEELARLPAPRPYLQMLGAMDRSSEEIVARATRLLGASGFSARSRPYEDVADYYRAADVFVLASLQEGFGRVYLEALMHGLPIIAHRHPVMEYVTGGLADLRDLTAEGELAAAVARISRQTVDAQTRWSRWTSVRDRFSWEVLAPRYMAMFREVAAAA
jgi:glycosyltransferase involved in cell wall biosynthesis